MKDYVYVYTDGSSRGNPGNGGYGVIIVEGNQVKELGGREDNTTNNRMELSAAVEALSNIDKSFKVKIYTDSQYLINGITKWVNGWMRNDWRTKVGGEVLNKDLWQKLIELKKDRNIEWIAVKGHAEVKGNNRADVIATKFADRENFELYNGTRMNYLFDIGEPTSEELMSESEKEIRNKKAYSYLSLVDGLLKKHNTWDSCKERVDGKRGTKYRKATSKEHEEEIIREWGL